MYITNLFHSFQVTFMRHEYPATCNDWFHNYSSNRFINFPANYSINFIRTGQSLFFFRSLIRSEEHTSELQSRFDLVCRLLLEKKKKKLHSLLHLITQQII